MAFHRCKIIFRNLKGISQGCKAISLNLKMAFHKRKVVFRNLKGTLRGCKAIS